MKKLLLSFTFLFYMQFISAQISNDNINIHMHLDLITFDLFDEGFDVEEYIFICHVNGVEEETGAYISQDPGIQYNKEIYDETNISPADIEVEFDSWEHDASPKFEFNGADDQQCGPATITFDPLAKAPGNQNTENLDCPDSDSSAKVRYFYRYNKGDSEGNPLNFGIIGNGMYEHTNRVVSPIDYEGGYVGNLSVNANLHYSDTKNNGVYSTDYEIFYIFQIDSGCKKVTFENTGTGNLTTYLTNYSNNQVGSIKSQASVDTPTDVYLDNGTYALVIEGSSTSAFDIKLTLDNPEPINGGFVSYPNS